MRITPIHATTIGVIDGLHVLSGWSTAFIPASTPPELVTFMSQSTTTVLALATWHVLPYYVSLLTQMLDQLTQMLDQLLKVHESTNRGIATGLATIAENTATVLQKFAAYLNKAAHRLRRSPWV